MQAVHTRLCCPEKGSSLTADTTVSAKLLSPQSCFCHKAGKLLMQQSYACNSMTHKPEPRLQVVINNAGVYGSRISLETVTAEDMLFTYKANTIGPLLVVQQLLKNKLIGKPATLVGNVTSKVHAYCCVLRVLQLVCRQQVLKQNLQYLVCF